LHNFFNDDGLLIGEHLLDLDKVAKKLLFKPAFLHLLSSKYWQLYLYIIFCQLYESLGQETLFTQIFKSLFHPDLTGFMVELSIKRLVVF
jgi:hypothetical protein